MFKSPIFMRVARLYLIGHRCDDIVHPFCARSRSPNIVNELGVSVRISALSCAQWVICVLHLTMRDWAHKYTQHTRRECTPTARRTERNDDDGDANRRCDHNRFANEGPAGVPGAARELPTMHSTGPAAADKVCTDYGHVPNDEHGLLCSLHVLGFAWGDLCTSLHFVWNSIGNYSKTLLYD